MPGGGLQDAGLGLHAADGLPLDVDGTPPPAVFMCDYSTCMNLTLDSPKSAQQEPQQQQHEQAGKHSKQHTHARTYTTHVT